jgi:hypothetical protein
MTIPKTNGQVASKRVGLYFAVSLSLLLLDTSWMSFFHSADPEAASFLAAASLVILLKSSCRRWVRRFLGKKRTDPVAEVLRSLADDYIVLNDIVLPDSKGTVDYLLIGPNGIFTIEIKNYSGVVKCEEDEWFVGGKPVRSLSKQAKRNSIAVRGCLAKLFSNSPTGLPYIVPLLVFLGPRRKLKVFKPTLAVLRLDELVEFIRNRESKRSITPDEKHAMVHHVQLLQRNFAYLADDESVTEAEPLDKAV